MRRTIYIIIKNDYNRRLFSQLFNKFRINSNINNNNDNQLITSNSRQFFDLSSFQPTSNNRKSGNSRGNRQEFVDQRIVRFTKSQLFNVVANVDDYDQFLPNCLESRILKRYGDQRMEAELVVGFPPLITEKYTSLIELDRPNRVYARSENSTVLKHLESEWKFEELNKKRTLITFNVEFEFYSQIHQRFMSLFFDDFTKKTMKAFLDRCYLIYCADPLYFDNDNP